jgi:hypothetical protein
MQVIRTTVAGRWALAVLIASFAPAKLLAQSTPAAAPPLPSPVGEQFSPTGVPTPAPGAIGPSNGPGPMLGSPAVGMAPPVVSGPPQVAAVAPSSPPPQSRLGLRHPRERGRLRAKLRSLLHREN